jgi:glucose-1-phosphate thymidylyltransferase
LLKEEGTRMKVIIPAAGIGKRLRPHTYSVPKALLHVAGKPMLGHILDIVRGLKPSQVILVVGFLGEQIVRYVSRNYKFKCKFIRQEELKGLGYALSLAVPQIDDREPVLIILGDTIFEADLLPVIRGRYDALGVKRVEDPRRFGIVEMKGGFVKKVVEKPEKPSSNLAVVGVYFIRDTSLFKESLSRIVAERIITQNEYQLTDALQWMIDRKAKFRTFNVSGWYDCGKPETLLETNRQLLAKTHRAFRIKGSLAIPPVFVSRSARVENCVVGPYVSVADGAVIKNSVVQDSIVGSGARVESSVLESSLIGNNAWVRGAVGRLNLGDFSEIESL